MGIGDLAGVFGTADCSMRPRLNIEPVRGEMPAPRTLTIVALGSGAIRPFGYCFIGESRFCSSELESESYPTPSSTASYSSIYSS